MNSAEKILAWSKKLHSLAQSGLTFTENPYEIERYEAIHRLAAEMGSFLSDQPVEKIYSLYRNEKGYTTPKVDVRGVVFREGKILLVKEVADGKWTLPGGWADVGDSPAEAVVREVYEESGFESEAVRLLALWDKTKAGHPPGEFEIYKIFIQCEITGGSAQPSIETSAVEFFDPDELPELSLPRTLGSQILRFREKIEKKEWQTDFH